MDYVLNGPNYGLQVQTHEKTVLQMAAETPRPAFMDFMDTETEVQSKYRACP